MEDKLDHPVSYVDLNDARAHARWAGKRLPAEQEWQYAAQGLDGRRYPWGDNRRNRLSVRPVCSWLLRYVRQHLGVDRCATIGFRVRSGRRGQVSGLGALLRPAPGWHARLEFKNISGRGDLQRGFLGTLAADGVEDGAVGGLARGELRLDKGDG